MPKLTLRGLPTKHRKVIVYNGNQPEIRYFVGGAWALYRKGVPLPTPARYARAMVEAKRGFEYYDGAPVEGPRAQYAVVRNMGMGDIIMVTPILRAMKQSWPWADVVLFTERRYLPLLRHNPDCQVQAMEDGVNGSMTFDLRGVSERAGDRQATERIDIYARECGVLLEQRQPRVYTVADEKKRGEVDLKAFGWEGRPLLGIQPISSRPERNYNLDRLGQVMEYFYYAEGMEIALFHNEPLDWTFPVPVINLASKTDMHQLINCVANCTAFLGVDSGVTHVAAGQGIPTVALTGPIRGALRYSSYPSVKILERTELPCVVRPHECYRCVRGAECLQFDPLDVIRTIGGML